MFRTSKRAFTLIEMLVVIAVIGILMAMLLPAVNTARESARRTTCNNNLKQMGLAVANYEMQNRVYPASGWVYVFSGDADMGVGKKQPGSWAFAILPFLEQNQLYVMTSNNNINEPHRAGIRKVNQTPLPVFNCPSRRPSQTYDGYSPLWNGEGDENHNIAKGDYGACCGTLIDEDLGINITTSDIHRGYPNSYADAINYMNNKTWPAPKANGVIFAWSEVSQGMVTDGTTNTFLIGEKYVRPEWYEKAGDLADNNGVFIGFDADNNRATGKDSSLAPAQDSNEYSPNSATFGSTHNASFGMVMCDGSVQQIGYEIELGIYSKLGHRADGTDASLSQ